MNWKVHEEFAGEQFVGYVLKDGKGLRYPSDKIPEVWLDRAKAEADCALVNAGVENNG